MLSIFFCCCRVQHQQLSALILSLTIRTRTGFLSTTPTNASRVWRPEEPFHPTWRRARDEPPSIFIGWRNQRKHFYIVCSSPSFKNTFALWFYFQNVVLLESSVNSSSLLLLCSDELLFAFIIYFVPFNFIFGKKLMLDLFRAFYWQILGEIPWMHSRCVRCTFILQCYGAFACVRACL